MTSLFKSALIVSGIAIGLVGNPFSALAENPDHLKQLRETGQCPGCDLSNTNLRGLTLTEANLQGANLIGANLSGANLIRANLSGANLTGANFTNAILTESNLLGANLVNADLTGVTANRANFQSANLVDTLLTRSNLSNSNFSTANLVGVDFKDAIVTDVIAENANVVNPTGLPENPADRTTNSPNPASTGESGNVEGRPSFKPPNRGVPVRPVGGGTRGGEYEPGAGTGKPTRREGAGTYQRPAPPTAPK